VSELKRELGLGYATLFGVGLILGAGIYVLVGRAAAIVGDGGLAGVAFSAVMRALTGAGRPPHRGVRRRQLRGLGGLGEHRF